MKASGAAARLSLLHYVAAFFLFISGGGWVAWLLVALGGFFLAVSYICSVIERKGES